jgi:FkbM family methyltransferase
VAENAPTGPLRRPLARPLLRAVPAGLGQVRLANYCYRLRFRGRAGGARRSTQLRDGSRFELELGDWPQARAFLLGEYDPDTVRFIGAALPEKGVFFDVGAHVGLISFQVLRHRPSARIHAFEPHPDRNAQYRRHRQLNGAEDQVEIIETALSDAVGEVDFDFDRHAIGERGTPVPTTTLDRHADAAGVERIDVLKLDVEGHELSALRGAEQMLSEGRIGKITLEAMDVHGDTTEAAALLESHGYRPVDLPSSPATALRRRLRAARPSANTAYELP